MNTASHITEHNASIEEAIKTAAMKVFLKNGFKGARLQEIADLAGINRAMLHYYFRSKEKLFEMVFREVIMKMHVRLTDVLQSSLPVKEKILAFVEHFVLDGLANPDFDCFFVNEFAQHPELLDEIIFCKGREKPLLLFKREIEEANARGEIKADAHMLIMNMLSLCAFPFVAKNMFQSIFQIDNQQLEQLIRDRLVVIQKMLIDFISIAAPVQQQ
jgi:AcrR family transcriptional regulator